MRTERIQYRYTEKEMRSLLASLVIMIDTREQANAHIIRYLQEKGVEWKEKALGFGDYSFMLPAAPDLGFARDVYFSGKFVIERKAGLDELSQNFAQERARFENELIRGSASRFVLLVENARYEDIVAGNYNTQYKPKSFVGTLFAFCHRYDMHVMFLQSRFSGNYIYHACYYYLYEYLKT